MRIGDHLSDNTKKKMHEKAKKKKREIDPEELEEKRFKATERMMGKYDQTLHRGKGGAWK